VSLVRSSVDRFAAKTLTRIRIDKRPSDYGQGEEKSASLTAIIFRPDSAAVPFHDALGDIEAKSHTTSITGGQLHEALEDRFQLVRRHAGTGISDRKTNITLERFDADNHRAVR
jgi:hypothetical protein